MGQDKVKIKLNGVSETLLGLLWGRAQLSKEYSSLFFDAKAVELVEKINYDFSTSDMAFQGILLDISVEGNLLPIFGLTALMAKQFDDKIKAYVTEHPRASVVNIGAGLDTTFYRIDNGTIHWYDLDLPNVIAIRKQLLPEPDRVVYIPKSLLDPSWCKDVKVADDGIFMVAGGVLRYFKESEVKQFFLLLADNFPGGEIVFDAISTFDIDWEWIDMFTPEQREVVSAALMGAVKDWWERAALMEALKDGRERAALMEAVKDWWEKAPQDQKDKAYNLIVALEISTKPKGREWSDIESWWNELSPEEIEEAWHDFRGYQKGFGMWALKDANEITKWDSRFTILDQFSFYKNVLRNSLSADIQRLMDYGDKSGRSTIIHLRF
ncbi:MAG TPA: class I SAM-dependent methyltransferase [Candidatus Acidoferrales bacterium]|nr:class I SAM-dependent methyltransferase [Candidatus Acidoferrales bacterium]